MADRITLKRYLVAIPAVALVAGLAFDWSGNPGLAGVLWAAGTVPVLLILLAEIVTSLRRGEVGLDIVAALSMTAAVAVGEPLAAVVVAIMYAGGQNLEDFADRRARREMTALLGRVPRTAMRHRDGGLEEVAIETIEPPDRLLIRRGDAVPVDGVVVAGVAVLDQAALTGESLPVRAVAGGTVMSGSINVGEAFDLTAAKTSAESTYAGIVRLVEAAQRSKAPMVRLADRFALVFLAVTLVLAGGAWLISGDAIRAVAVLVVATPCPLILAVPVALVAGLSRAAKQGILIKGGKALEALARVKVLVVDKTGTLTRGVARVVSIVRLADIPEGEVLRLAASLDQASGHVLAQAIVAEATRRGLPLSVPGDVAETSGEGLVGLIDGDRVALGGIAFVAALVPGGSPPELLRLKAAGAAVVAVAFAGRMVGAIVLADELRPEAAGMLTELRRGGIRHIILATGDREEVARSIAAGLPIDEVRSRLTPDDKVAIVTAARVHGPVLMTGDGVNDAPALAAADVSVAMGATGAAAAAEVADVVLLVDDVGRLAPAIAVARRSRAIALQSVYAGIGLSFVGMVVAAFGYLPPVAGALVQEAIDVAVILNALRALRGGAPPPLASARTN
ncbi:MAG: heavy metal translocating P-type ATPase [Bauldia sp.]|nr:heavy metal translocating P-type ATPase [Bauldia sp.]